MDRITTIRNLILDLNEAIKRTEKQLKNAPEGHIVLRSRNNVPLFYRRIGTEEEYLGAEKEDKIKALAQKKYDIEILRTFKSEKIALERLKKNLEGTTKLKSEQQVWEQFPEALKKYVTQDRIIDEGYIQRWKNQTWKIKHDTSEYKFISLKGERVRSKSEVIIADRLYHLGIPYHYEKNLPLGPSQYGQFVLRPDFTILNKRTLETFYWEHFGKMDDDEYFTSTKEKLEIYADSGLFPGKGLILSFETDTSPLNVVYINKLIEEYLI